MGVTVGLDLPVKSREDYFMLALKTFWISPNGKAKSCQIIFHGSPDMEA